MAKRNISVFYSSYCGQMLDRERYRNHGIHARGNGSMQHRSATFQTSVRGFPGALVVKNLPTNAGGAGDVGSVPG